MTFWLLLMTDSPFSPLTVAEVQQLSVKNERVMDFNAVDVKNKKVLKMYV